MNNSSNTDSLEYPKVKKEIDYELARNILACTPAGMVVFRKLWRYLMSLDNSEEIRKKLLENSEVLMVHILVLSTAYENGGLNSKIWYNEENNIFEKFQTIGLEKHYQDIIVIIEDAFGMANTMSYKERVMEILDNK